MSLNHRKLPYSNWVPSEDLQRQDIDLKRELERLSLIPAQAWKDEHPDACLESDIDFCNCVNYVTVEMAIAGAAVGGAIGLEILTGGGSEAARSTCRLVLSSSQNSSY
ncbi:MAG: hypothetical protein HC769_20410 [Cyanobacteria bacterium CRU_2_1]|nr:hypothetical protein [Cyanobacteria bacterium CRU_2_1]